MEQLYRCETSAFEIHVTVFFIILSKDLFLQAYFFVALVL